MTGRERLIELLKVDTCPGQGIEDCYECVYSEYDDCYTARTADYLIANGVTVWKKEKTVKFLPCKCGKNSHIEWYNQGGSVSYECKYCGLKSPAGRSVNEARELWNEMIRSAERSEERGG